jgi:hypothetical protein
MAKKDAAVDDVDGQNEKPAADVSTPAEDAEGNPAEDARQEAVGETPQPARVEFRGDEFIIDRSVLQSFRLRMAVAQGNTALMVAELVDPVDLPRLTYLVARGESHDQVFAEFMGAVNKALGWTKGPNS